MASQEDIAHQQNLLAIHRRNLAHYLNQQTLLGGAAYTPPSVVNGLLEERTNIKRIKGILRGWGQTVGDHPDDEPPPAPPTTASSGQGARTQVGRDQIDARESQGYIGQAGGPVSQNFGEQQNVNAGTVIYIQGGDFRGTNLPIGNTVGRDLNQGSGASASTFNQPGWNVQGNVYNIAGDLNMSPNPGKDELLAALQQLKDELAKAQDLPADEASDLKTNLNAAIEAIERPQPNKDCTVKKLSTMKENLDGLKDDVGSALALGHLIGQVLQAAQRLVF